MKKEQNKVHQLSDYGEFELIELLTKNIQLTNDSSIKGVGDDAAVLDYPDKKVLVTTDLLVEGIHFNLVYTPLKHLGYKAVTVNLSDIYAMNGIPKQITFSMALSSKFPKEAVDELYSGILLACSRYGVDLVGGDTSSSLTGLTISVTAIGEGNEDTITYRSEAQANDLICVSGDLGAAYMGLMLLERERRVFEGNANVQPDLKGYEYILERQLKPEARKDIIASLCELGIVPSSMIDISDGLSSELLHICKSSGTGCSIFVEKIPIHPETCKMAEELNIDPVTCALNGGEDYELLFTVPLAYHEKIKELSSVSIIGYIKDKSEGCGLVTADNKSIELTAKGWKSF